MHSLVQYSTESARPVGDARGEAQGRLEPLSSAERAIGRQWKPGLLPKRPLIGEGGPCGRALLPLRSAARVMLEGRLERGPPPSHPGYTMRCAVLRCAAQRCCAAHRCSALLSYSIQYNNIQYNKKQYNTIQYTTIQYYTILHYTMAYHIYYIIPYHTIIHYTELERRGSHGVGCVGGKLKIMSNLDACEGWGVCQVCCGSVVTIGWEVG